MNISTLQKSVCQNRSICLQVCLFYSIHNRAPFFRYWQCYLCVIVRYSSVKNSSSAYKALIFILLKLGYVCWGSPDEHFAVCPTSAGQKTTEIHGVEVDQSSSTIFRSHDGRKCPIFLMISFLYLSSLMQDKFISCETIG